LVEHRIAIETSFDYLLMLEQGHFPEWTFDRKLS